jgi:hypothetical protein
MPNDPETILAVLLQVYLYTELGRSYRVDINRSSDTLVEIIETDITKDAAVYKTVASAINHLISDLKSLV